LATRERGVFLADNALAQTLFHVHKLLRFALEQPPDGNACPLAHQLGDIFLVDFFLQHARVIFERRQSTPGLPSNSRSA